MGSKSARDSLLLTFHPTNNIIFRTVLFLFRLKMRTNSYKTFKSLILNFFVFLFQVVPTTDPCLATGSPVPVRSPARPSRPWSCSRWLRRTPTEAAVSPLRAAEISTESPPRSTRSKSCRHQFYFFFQTSNNLKYTEQKNPIVGTWFVQFIS